MYIKYSHL